MFHLNVTTAPPSTAATGSPAPSSSAPSPPPPTPAPDAVPWSTIDAEENDPFSSAPSTPTNDGAADSTTPSGTGQQPSSPELQQQQQQQVLSDQGAYPHCPIFIPSKGRGDMERCTMATLIRDLVPFVLVVEKEEADAYRALLDHLVGQRFGFSGMVYASTIAGSSGSRCGPESADNAAGTGGRDSKDTDGATTARVAEGSDLWPFPCACCCRDEKQEPEESSHGKVIEALAQRLSTAFHHGYVFEPPTQAATEKGGPGENSSNSGVADDTKSPTSAATPAAGRRAAPSFVLRDVQEIRALFEVAVLPESNRGVSYVRNYILQVLAPRLMVACGVDRTGNIEELCLAGPGEHSTLTPAALRSAGLEESVYGALQDKAYVESYLASRRLARADDAAATPSPTDKTQTPPSASSSSSPPPTPRPASPSLSGSAATSRDTPRLLHGLFGFYWVLDDDIYGFYRLPEPGQKQQRISSRAMLREMSSRLLQLRRNADRATTPPPPVPPAGHLVASATSSATGAASPTFSPSTGTVMVTPMQQQHSLYVFTGKEDALANNFVGGGKSKPPTLSTYTYYYTTACFSLEYNRFALGSSADAMAVNSYNNIACLFNYALLHNPPQMRYFPPGVPNVRRPEDALVGYLGHSMLWYRFAIREDYDFTLQLIARGLYTLRFRSLSFDVPQMMKVRGGMTDYYRNCHDEIRLQNNRFVLQWPAIAQHWVKGKDDTKRDDIRVRWDLLSPARAKYPGAFLYLASPLPQLQPQRVAEEEEEEESDAVASGDGSDDSAVDFAGSNTAETRKRQRPASPLDGASLSRPAPQATASSSPASFSKAHTTSGGSRHGGYVVERWRDMSVAEARQHAGLEAIPNEDVHIGRTVAVIPPFFEQRPSVVLATVIERSVAEDEGGRGAGQQQQQQHSVVWTAVAQDVRGMPFLHVKVCYYPPAEGIASAAAKVDKFFGEMK